MSYWNQRKCLGYYKQVLEFARIYVPDGGSILDVGSGDCKYITWFDWFEEKQIIDIKNPPTLEGVISISGNFMDLHIDKLFDLVLCLQVLEHLHSPEDFCKKLLSVSKFAIISIPYKWSRGTCQSHLHDPVDEEKLTLWAGKDWIDKAVIKDGKQKRFIVVYEGIT